MKAIVLPVCMAVIGVCISQVAGSVHTWVGLILAIAGGLCVGIAVPLAYFRGARHAP